MNSQLKLNLNEVHDPMQLTERQKTLLAQMENILRSGVLPSQFEKIHDIFRKQGWEGAKNFIVKDVMKR